MTASTEPHSDTEVAVPAKRHRTPPAWLLGALSAIVVIVVVMLIRGGGDEPDATGAGPADVTTPQGAAEAFARASAAGDVAGVLDVTCLGNAGCAAAQGGPNLTPEQIAAAKDVVAANVRDIGARFGYAEFTGVRDGARPGTREVDYRLPGTPAGERNYLVFVEHDGRWFYIATGGGSGATGGAPAT